MRQASTYLIMEEVVNGAGQGVDLVHRHDDEDAC